MNIDINHSSSKNAEVEHYGNTNSEALLVRDDNAQQYAGFKPRINKFALHFMCFALGMFAMQIGWTICGNNQPGKVILAQLGYITRDDATPEEKDKARNIDSLISSSSIFGMVIGSLISGSLVAYGRRKMLILFGIIGMVFTALTLVPNLVCILIGRCVFGIATGVFMTAAPRMLDETVPQHLIGSFGVYTNVYANLGVMGTLLLGIGLPQSGSKTYQQDLITSQFWKVCYGLPIFFVGIGVALLLTIFKEDSLLFLVQKERKQEAMNFIKQIYASDEDHEKIYLFLRSSTSQESSGVSVRQALSDPKYSKATWLCFILTLFHQNCGLNALNMYSNQMIEKIGDKFPLSPTQATYFVGIFGFIGGAILGPIVIPRLNRKVNFLYGHLTMGISMILMAFFKIWEWNVPLFGMICLYCILFQTSQGALIWIYTSEVLVDAAGGLVVFGVFGMLLIQSLFLSTLMDKIQPEGVFFMFGGITILGFFFVLFLIKDTTGKSDKEKKSLYQQEQISKVSTDY